MSVLLSVVRCGCSGLVMVGMQVINGEFSSELEPSDFCLPASITLGKHADEFTGLRAQRAH